MKKNRHKARQAENGPSAPANNEPKELASTHVNPPLVELEQPGGVPSTVPYQYEKLKPELQGDMP